MITSWMDTLLNQIKLIRINAIIKQRHQVAVLENVMGFAKVKAKVKFLRKNLPGYLR